MNDWHQEIYENHGTWVRRRSPDNVLDEIEDLRGRYEGVKTVRFLDHAFALDAAWLTTFAGTYQRRCDLPFRCHLRANSLDAERVRVLTEAGCRYADVELISGSDFLRNDIFDMELSAEQIVGTFALLRAADIRVRAIVYLGAPYESEAASARLRGHWLQLRRMRMCSHAPSAGDAGRQRRTGLHVQEGAYHTPDGSKLDAGGHGQAAFAAVRGSDGVGARRGGGGGWGTVAATAEAGISPPAGSSR